MDKQVEVGMGKLNLEYPFLSAVQNKTIKFPQAINMCFKSIRCIDKRETFGQKHTECMLSAKLKEVTVILFKNSREVGYR